MLKAEHTQKVEEAEAAVLAAETVILKEVVAAEHDSPMLLMPRLTLTLPAADLVRLVAHFDRLAADLVRLVDHLERLAVNRFAAVTLPVEAAGGFDFFFLLPLKYNK